MASEVDISNLALSRIGDEATVSSINPAEGSAQAEHCARFYPMARDSMLEAHGWRFATRRAVLAALSISTWTWSYAYAMPNGLIRVLAVLPPDAPGDADTQRYETETDGAGTPIIYTDQPSATLRYIARVTDTAKFSPLFVDALAWLLASYLAGPILKGDSGVKIAAACLNAYQTAFSAAKVSDANQRNVRAQAAAPWIRGR
ncbi:hypothetical protein [Castellaniella sp.]|uniref:hypothetical protein n=1 Tax=Castellaniella sp. TaxID=1955812 RepID=UPI002AFF3265|nr:hypothetical protein [Castellaniella sp.]